MANLIINQSGIPAGVAGQSRSDGLRTGATVDLSHDESSAAFTSFQLLWVPEDDTTASSTFAQVGNTASFNPDPASVGGTYRIKLTVTTSAGTSTQIRLFAIRTLKASLRIPALNERADEAASLVNNGSAEIAASEFNEPSPSGPFVAGNYGGWMSAYNELVTVVETLSTPATSPSGWDVLLDFDFTAQPNGAPHPTTAPGTYTEVIGGVTWKGRFAGNTNPGPAPQQQLNGVGYRLLVAASNIEGFSNVGSYIATDHKLLPGYVAGRYMCVVAVVQAPAPVSIATRALVGHFEIITPANQGNQTIVSYSGIMGGWSPRYAGTWSYFPVLSGMHAVSQPPPASTWYPALPSLVTADFVFGAKRFTGTRGDAVYGPYSGTLPKVEDLRTIASTDEASYAGGLSPLISGVAVGCDQGPTVAYAFNVKRLIIYQAKS